MKESHREALGVAVSAAVFVLAFCLVTFIYAATVYLVWNTICLLLDGVSPITASQSVAAVITVFTVGSIFRQRSPE